jgi:hypothetical protein
MSLGLPPTNGLQTAAGQDLVSYFTSGLDKQPSVPTAKAAEPCTAKPPDVG